MNSFSRAMTALVLAASLLAGSMAAFAQTPTKSPEQNQTSNSTQTDPKTTQASTPATTPTTANPTIARSTKPLSTNENPDMIGKRNINTGIIAKMSGSTEKEVRSRTSCCC